MKNFLFANVIFFFSLNASANCEAGGYSIHTVAVYSLDENLFIMNGAPGKLRNLGNSVSVGTYKTDIPGCGDVKLSMIPPLTKEDGEGEGEVSLDEMKGPYYKLEGCGLDDVSNFYKFDTKTKKVTVSKSVAVSSVPTSDKITSSIRKEMEKLKLQPLQSASEDKVIAKEDIKNLSNFPIVSTQVGKSLTMSIANLDIINLQKYFSVDGYKYYGEKYFKFEKRMAIFPVIFFTVNDRTFYVGDGSWCSEVPVIYRNISLTDRELSKGNPKYVKSSHSQMAGPDEYKQDQDGYFNLGKIHEYNVTAAYDFNNDGKPDILVINDAITYFVQENGGLVVLESEQGC